MNYTQQAPRRKNYTPLPNEVFSLGLSPGELAVYAYLLYCEDRRTYQSWPSYKTIGRAIHRSKGAVKRYVDGLVVKGLITAEPTSVIMQNSLKKNGNLCGQVALPTPVVFSRSRRRTSASAGEAGGTER